MTDREIMQQALEALDAYSWEQVQSATTALRDRLEQPEQEPVAWIGLNLDNMAEAFHRVIEEHHSRKNPFHDPVNGDAMIALRELRGLIAYMKRNTAPPQRKPEQEPSVEQLNSAIEAWFENFETRSYQERMQHAFKAAHGIKGEA